MFVLGAILIVTVFQNSYATQIEPCSAEGIPEPIRVDIIYCDVPPCPLVKGKNAEVNVTFRVPYDIETGIFKIKVSLGPLHINYPPPDKNYCHGLLNAYCPLEEGEIVVHHFGLPVLKAYPTGTAMNLKFTFFDENSKPVMCYSVDGKVVDKI